MFKEKLKVKGVSFKQEELKSLFKESESHNGYWDGIRIMIKKIHIGYAPYYINNKIGIKVSIIKYQKNNTWNYTASFKNPICCECQDENGNSLDCIDGVIGMVYAYDDNTLPCDSCKRFS